MKSNRIAVDNRPEVVLNTDLLPFERTLPYSNDGYFRYQVSKKKTIPTLLKRLTFDGSVKIPFLYEYRRNNFKSRTVGIIHPLEQLKFVEFYHNHTTELLYFNKRSKFSLRHLTSKVKSLSINSDSVGLLHPTKFFNYGPYRFLHEFYTSFEYIRIEKTFKYQLKADISKCFDSIYTHSLSWAVTTKTHAKKNLKAGSFDQTFDSLMQSANYKETNGIIIGPEISRIFAEIILQNVDVQIEERLKLVGLIYGKSYKIRRYVDDYMIFANSLESTDFIYGIIEEELTKYKLSLNESKKTYSVAPFMSSISAAKIEISEILNKFYNQFIQTSLLDNGEAINMLSAESIKGVKKPYELSMSFINQMKGLIEDKNIKISDISRFAVSIIKIRILRLLKVETDFSHLDDNKSKNLTQFLCVNINILLYFISLDTVVTNITKAMTIADRINHFYTKNKLDGLDLVRLQFANELKFTIRKYKHKENGSSIEFIQMLLCLKMLGSENGFNAQEINSIIDVDSLNYWGITGLLYFFGKNKEYDIFRNQIHKIVLSRMSAKNSMSYSEWYCLFFDYLKCPNVSLDKKRELVIFIAKQNDIILSGSEINANINFIKKYNWFFNWNRSIKKLLSLHVMHEAY